MIDVRDKPPAEENPAISEIDRGEYPDLTCKNPNRLKEKLRGRFGKESTPNWSSYCLSASLMHEKYRSRKKIFLNK